VGAERQRRDADRAARRRIVLEVRAVASLTSLNVEMSVT
jgi:hypothetical protein